MCVCVCVLCLRYCCLVWSASVCRGVFLPTECKTIGVAAPSCLLYPCNRVHIHSHMHYRCAHIASMLCQHTVSSNCMNNSAHVYLFASSPSPIGFLRSDLGFPRHKILSGVPVSPMLSLNARSMYRR